MNLLQKAKGIPMRGYRGTYKEDEVEKLAVAWLTGEVTYSQACKALKQGGSTVYGSFAVALRRAVAGGRLKVTQK